MTKKWIAINLLLLAVTGLLARQLHVSILRFKAENDLAKIQPARDMKQAIVTEKPMPHPAPVKTYLPAEFAIIPEKNVFSDSRSKEEKPEVVVVPETPPLTQKPILVGVSIEDLQKKALIIDPASSPQDKNRRAQTKRIGDVYRGYTITDIAIDRIVLESGTRREIIPLREGTKKVQGGKTPILSTRVVSFGGGAASGGTPVAVAGGGGSPARTTVTAVASSPAPAAQVSGGSAPAVQVRQPAPAPAATSQPAMQQVAPTTQTTPTVPGGRVIRTPFGDVVRPNRN